MMPILLDHRSLNRALDALGQAQFERRGLARLLGFGHDRLIAETDIAAGDLIRCDSLRSTLVMPECRDDIARTFFGSGVQSEPLAFLSFLLIAGPSAGGQGHLCFRRSSCWAWRQCWLARKIRFGEKKIELLRRFLQFKDGTPSHDQLCDIFGFF
jgi:hypothetical protein